MTKAVTVEEIVAYRRRLSEAEAQAREEACRRNGHSRAETASNIPQPYCSMCLRLIDEAGRLIAED